METVTLGAAGLTDYTVPLATTANVRFVSVCRGGWGDSRDDVAIDVAFGRCL